MNEVSPVDPAEEFADDMKRTLKERLGDFKPTRAELDQLNEKQRKALERFESEESYQAAAMSLGIPLNTFKTRMHRARAKILAMRAGANARSGDAAAA